ncbi:uncharacterized protein SCHCODRAFT_01039388 [Schizophyllum commune H4-8]|uniref:uncharacterized protein n=1 Tax=Schizophyllum commune (strain H4-8 / FGSC 9210) TaxID=578458 RepID=UPI0021601280|nr:uncharacterized protein SCHCODRAFT_01039388 [Schizophyllum commune H4-8]KAI5887863.1 hypothetical protein SCHCODRAFT_01039388 [Schizophyllum commune H4-8]
MSSGMRCPGRLGTRSPAAPTARAPASTTLHPAATTTPPSAPLSPQPSPDRALEHAFFAYICVLGHAHRSPDIALALAWMRALRVRPRPRTLAVALALWAEVAMEAPLVQRMSRGDEYARLEAWIEQWAREAGFRVPEARSLSKWRRWLEKQRGE